jgi:hypothetical protein
MMGQKFEKNNIEYTYYKTINIIIFLHFLKLSTEIRLKMCNVYLYESIFSCAQYVILCKKLSHPSFSYVLFYNSTHKTETGTTNRWGTTNSKSPGQIIMMGQAETLSSS